MSALNFLKINNGEDEDLPFVKALYESAFPVQERRDWPTLIAMIGTSEMQLEVVKDQDRPIAFVIWWTLNDCLFIEHLAVSSVERGKNYGSRVINHYLDRAQGKMFLEVEPPLTEEAERRVKFYERLGLHVLDYDYQQPSYREEGVFYPMKLMGTKPDFAEQPGFSSLVELMKSKVYG